MLIIEGSDCLGKTTLANKIAERLHVPVVHMTRPDEKTFNFFSDYAPMIMPNIIRDRFHLGGIAYHDNKITEARLRIIEGCIYSHGSVIVLLYASDFRAYAKRLEADTRKSILTIEAMELANLRFYEIAEGMISAQVDLCFDVLNGGEMHYVNDYGIDKIIGMWLERRREYSEFLKG